MEHLLGKTIKQIQYGINDVLIEFTDKAVIKFFIDHMPYEDYDYINYKEILDVEERQWRRQLLGLLLTLRREGVGSKQD